MDGRNGRSQSTILIFRANWFSCFLADLPNRNHNMEMAVQFRDRSLERTLVLAPVFCGLAVLAAGGATEVLAVTVAVAATAAGDVAVAAAAATTAAAAAVAAGGAGTAPDELLSVGKPIEASVA